MPSARKWRPLLVRFIDNLRIVSREETAAPGEAGIRLKLWQSQQRVLDDIASGMDDGIRRFYVLKSRQLGSTTIAVIVALFWLALHPGMKGALVVDQEKTRDDFREQIRNIINSIPVSYFGGSFGIKRGGDNRYFMGFTNGSQLNFLVAGTSGSKVAWGESSGYSLVLLTEVANYGSPDGLTNFEEAMSDTNPERLYIYESTAKGFNHWRTRWLDARKDVFTSRCIFVGWWAKELNRISMKSPLFSMYGVAPPDDRERTRIKAVKEQYGWDVTPEQLAWYRWRASKEQQTEGSLNQNQPWTEQDAFVETGQSFFQIRQITKDYERLDERWVDDENVEHIRGGYQGYRFWLGQDFWSAGVENLQNDPLRQHEVQLRMWHPPHPEGRYVIGCDPAGGSDDKNDRHAISVWRCYADKLVQVAEYADNLVETRQAAWVLAYLAGVYKNCLINIELSGGYGKAVLVELDHLREMLMADVYGNRRAGQKRDLDISDFLNNARYHIHRKPDTPAAAGYTLHFLTTGDLKRQIFNEYRDSHVNGALEVMSKPLLEEMHHIRQEGSEIGAPGNSKDDRCFAACLANHSWIQHERSAMLMSGETFLAVSTRENSDGRARAGHIVDQIVFQYLRQVEAGQTDEVMNPAQAWMIERGLA